MKKVRNEQGYTLLLTMVLIIVVVLFFTTFTMKALSQQKQVEKTDENYEVTAIAEMGVEYYRAEILNLIYRYADLLVSELTLPEKDRDSDEVIKKKYLDQLYDKIKTLPSKIEVASDKYFEVEGGIPNAVSNYPLKLLINGHKGGEIIKKIEVTFIIPQDLTKPSLINQDGENGSNDGIESGSENFSINHLIQPPDFLIVSPSSKCVTPIINNLNKPCYTDDLSTLKDLKSNTVFYTGNEIKNFPQSDNKDYNNSYIYANGKVNFNWLNNNKNLSIQIKGEGKLPQFKNLNNISVYIQGKGYHDELSGTKYILYGEGNQEFTSTVNLENSIIEVTGTTKFNNSTVFKNNSKILLLSSVTFVNTINFQKSEVTIIGPATFENSTIINNESTAEIHNTSLFKNTLDVQNSKLYVTGFSTFKNDLRVSKGYVNFFEEVEAIRINSHNNSTVCLRKGLKGNQGVNIDNSSNIYILNDTGLEKKSPYNKWGSKDPIYLNPEQYESKCPSPVNSNPKEPIDYNSINPTAEEITGEIIYK